MVPIIIVSVFALTAMLVLAASTVKSNYEQSRSAEARHRYKQAIHKVSGMIADVTPGNATTVRAYIDRMEVEFQTSQIGVRGVAATLRRCVNDSLRKQTLGGENCG